MMTTRSRLRLAAAAAALALTAGAAAAQQKELRFAFGFPESFATYPSVERYAANVEKETGLKIKIFTTSLLTPAEIMAGVRDGLADIGWDSMPYNPVDFSEGGLAPEFSMMVTSGEVPIVPGAAMTGAVLEYILLNCPECQAQFKAQNAVVTATTGTTPYYLICTEPMATLADVKGKRIRTAAGNFERWAAAVGAAGVPMPGNEIYDALSQKVLNCTSNDLSQLVGLRLMDVATFANVGTPGGVYGGSTIANWNRDVWQGLTQEQRASLLRLGARFSAETVMDYQTATAAAVDDAKAKGVSIVEAADDLKAATAAFIEGDKATIEKQYVEKYGMQDVPKKIETITALIDKWKVRMKDVPADAAAIEEIYWTEVFSKLDPATYGMD